MNRRGRLSLSAKAPWRMNLGPHSPRIVDRGTHGAVDQAGIQEALFPWGGGGLRVVKKPTWNFGRRSKYFSRYSTVSGRSPHAIVRLVGHAGANEQKRCRHSRAVMASNWLGGLAIFPFPVSRIADRPPTSIEYLERAGWCVIVSDISVFPFSFFI